MKNHRVRNIALCCAVAGLLTLVGCASSDKGDMARSGYPQTSKTVVADPSHAPQSDADVVKTYDDVNYGKTELRADDYHRHVDPQSPTGWTPWHHRRARHRWADDTPAAKPAPTPGLRKVTAKFASATLKGDGKNCCGQVELTKVAPGEVAVGQEFEYKLIATNTSSLKLLDVVVTDELPGDFKVASSEPAVEGTKDGKTMWMLGEIEPGASKTITIKGAAQNPGKLVNCATVSFTPYVCLATNVVEPSLQLTKTAPSEVLLCDRIPITLTVTNNGTGTARNVVINDTLPDGLVTESGDSKVKINVGDLSGGQSKKYVINAKPLDTGKYENKAVAMAEGGLKANASSTTMVREPVLKITKSGPEKMFINKDITYNVKITNTGDAPADNTVVTDTLPAGTTFVSASSGGTMEGGKVTWNLGTLGVKDSRDLSVTVKSANAGTFKNSVTAKAKCAKAVDASASTMVTGIPAILLEVVDVDDPIAVGNNVTYVITVTNQGSAPGTNIKIGATLEDTMQFVSAGGATSGKAEGKNVTFAPIQSLAPKAKATFRVTVKAVKSGDVRFAVEMTSDQITRPVNETEATNFFE